MIDTGPFYARADSRDRQHEKSLEAWQRLEGSGERLVTTSHVVAETITLISRRMTYRHAARVGRTLLSSSILLIVPSDRELEIRALELLEKWADQAVSFADCVSFATTERLDIQRVFTFDRHFMLAGYETWPDAFIGWSWP